MDTLSFTEDDKEVLVTIVKTVQQLDLKGTCGGWKEFLAATNAPGAFYDPAKRPWHVLADFVKTLTNNDHHLMVKRIKKWRNWCMKTRQADINDPWPDTREQCLVNLTRQNPRFFVSYTFPSFQEGWKCTKRGASSHASTPERLLSMDCEMVMCENNESQVVQVCIVDRNYQTLLNTMVKPSRKVVDYITYIHGIPKSDIDNATCTQEEIQKKVKKLLTPGTILVGHSLYNDLKALRIDHRRVIDTSLVFRPKGVPNNVLYSLHELCKAFLGYSFREDGKPHICLDDAIIPMKLVLQELEHGPSEAVQYALNNASKRDSARLFIHSIPKHLSMEELKTMISNGIPCTIEKVEKKKGQAYAVFSTRALADKAFNDLPGELGQDSCGLEQKTVSSWKNAQYIQFRVRKMFHNGEDLTEGPSKRGQDGNILQVQKRLKVNENGNMPTEYANDADIVMNVCTCGKGEEVEKLKKQLEASNAQIISLKKLIANINK